MSSSQQVESEDGLLVVDDDEMFRNRLVRALKDRGFRAYGAADVQSGLATLEDISGIKRIVVDLKMPGRSGLELVQEITRQHPDIQAVILTGYGSIATATTAIKLGAVNYLSKPVTVEQILKAFAGDMEDGGDPDINRIDVPSLSQVEWDHIQRVIADCGGNISHAAKKLGVHRRSLQRKLQKSPGTLK